MCERFEQRVIDGAEMKVRKMNQRAHQNVFMPVPVCLPQAQR